MRLFTANARLAKALGLLWLLIGSGLAWNGVRILSLPAGSPYGDGAGFSEMLALVQVVLALPFLVSAIGLLRRWQGTAIWEIGPSLLLVVAVYAVWSSGWS